MANYQAEVVAGLCRELIRSWRRLKRECSHPNHALRRASGNTQRKTRANGGGNGRRQA
jgi:hypothetical protein